VTEKARAFAAGLALAGLVGTASGCALDARVDVQFTGGSSRTVTESSQSVELDSHSVRGVTSRRRKVGIDCSLSIVYDANDIGGPGVVVQTRRVRLRTRRVPRGTAYDLDCSGPLIVQLPKAASAVQATAVARSSQPVLPVQAPVSSVPIAFGRRLRAQRGTQLALIRQPDTLQPGDYRIELSFHLPGARPIFEKVVYAASVSCGRSTYVEPLLPAVSKMKRAHGVTISPSERPFSVNLPRIAGARENGVPVERSRRLSC
jgi:hypothetical protein